MKKNYDLCLIVTLILCTFLLMMSGIRRKEESLAARIAPEILRFHVLANSDSPEDQELKLEVKSLLLDTIRETVRADSRDSIETYIYENHDDLEHIAESFMKNKGFDYEAEIRLETCVFPEKTYGDMTFPAGTYDAVRVILGSGKGQNFWCVLYPSLCYLDSTYAVVPEESKQLLRSLIPEDDFAALVTKNSGQNLVPSRIHIRFKFLERFN